MRRRRPSSSTRHGLWRCATTRLVCLVVVTGLVGGIDAFVTSPPPPQQQQQATHSTVGASFVPTRMNASTTGGTAFQRQRPLSAHNHGSSSSRARKEAIPFLVERLPARPNPHIYSEIAALCIAAFFNDDAHTNNNNNKHTTPLWKEAQLAYLRRLQTADLERRRRRDGTINMMFVARAVVPVDSVPRTVAARQPLLLDLRSVYNLNNNNNKVDYIRGDLLGFVEVTQRSYGIGAGTMMDDEEEEEEEDNDDDDDDTTNNNNNRRTNNFRIATRRDASDPENSVRPVLTNLAVRKAARTSGVGSALVQVCESHVQRQWRQSEVILEVEDDNDTALTFYQRRGYQILFDDPASRRYDCSGVWLAQVRTTRRVLRKNLSVRPKNSLVSSLWLNNKNNNNSGPSTVSQGWQALQRWKESVFSTV